MKKNKFGNIDLPLTAGSLLCVFIVVIFMVLKPEATTDTISYIFRIITGSIGPFILWFCFLGIIAAFCLAFSKFGRIKLGEGKPKYSTFSYVTMLLCASLASTYFYYSFIEWGYYYGDPTFRIEPFSEEAAEMATPYAFFHWGGSAMICFILTALTISYAFYVRQATSLRVSAICEEMIGNNKGKKVIGKLVDGTCVISMVGGLGVSLGLGVPLISQGLSGIFGISQSFSLNVAVVFIISVLFSFSSYIGIEKGMQKISNYTIYLSIIFSVFILIFGPTSFIIKQTTNSVGVLLSNYVRMSLWTDPIGNHGFPEANTMFLFTLTLNYAAMMGIFITRISKGRTIRQMILISIIGMCTGAWTFIAINSSFSMNAQITGQLNVVDYLFKGQGEVVVYRLMELLPGGILIPIVFLVILIGFLATSLDTAAFSLAATTSSTLDTSGNPNPIFRLFWCIILAAIPLSIMFVGAPFDTLKTICIVTAIPFTVVIIFMFVKTLHWMHQDIENGLLERQEQQGRDELAGAIE